MAKKRGRQMVRPVADGLKAIGIDPVTVGDVILSHMHYDHAGNLPLFPKARFHIQDAEMEYVTGRSMCHAALRGAFEADHAAQMVHNVFDGRVEFHDGVSELAPGITLHKVGGHTKGLQVTRVKTRRGWVVLAVGCGASLRQYGACPPIPDRRRCRRLSRSVRHHPKTGKFGCS